MTANNPFDFTICPAWLEKGLSVLSIIGLFCIAYYVADRSDRAIAERTSRHPVAFHAFLDIPPECTGDERRVANQFIADTLPRLMKLGLISKYQRDEKVTALYVPGHIWKARTRFVKQSVLTAVSAYNKVNGLSLWTMVLDDRTGTMYAQVLPSNRKELYQ